MIRILNLTEEERTGVFITRLPGVFEAFLATLEEKPVERFDDPGRIGFTLRGKGLLTLLFRRKGGKGENV